MARDVINWSCSQTTPRNETYRVMHTQHVDDDVILIPLIRAMAYCLNSGKLRFVAALASKLLRSSSSRLQATRNVSYCILRATNTATNRREISHITSINGPALQFQFSSLGCCLGCGVRGHIKSPTPLWITVPGMTGGVLRERERAEIFCAVARELVVEKKF